MKTQAEKTTTSEIIDIIQDYTSKKDPSQFDLISLVNTVFDKVVVKWINAFNELSNPIVEDAEDLSDFILDVADLILVSTFRSHSLDTSDMPYEMPQMKMSKLKRHFTKILISNKNKRNFSNELFSLMFCLAYLPSARKASEHRKLVLKNKGKQKPENN